MYEYQDANGKPIQVGSKVRWVGEPDICEIVSISDPDGDVDDEGRSIGIPPRAHVVWTENGEPCEDYTDGRDTAVWYGDEDAPFRFDDLEVIS